jgi:hypothetical protein
VIGTKQWSITCYQTKTEWWQHYRNREDLDDDDDSRTVKVPVPIVSLLVGCSLSQNYHREAIQNEISLRRADKYF